VRLTAPQKIRDEKKTTFGCEFAPFNRHRDRTLWMDVASAETTKYAANAMLAVRVSFMNEMANLADQFGADIDAVRRGIGADARLFVCRHRLPEQGVRSQYCSLRGIGV
jgi:UDP-glucose 6-dehydrogenase